MQETSNSLAKTFEGVEIRTTPEGRMVAIDVLKGLGQKDPYGAWRNIKKRHPEFMEESSLFRDGKGGRPTDALSEQGVYKLAMVAGGPKAAQFREWASDLIQRVRTADPALTAELIDRTENVDDLKRLETRARTKRTNKQLNATIQKHGGSCYALVADLNNVAVTGKRAHEIKRLENVKQTREGMSTAELSLIAVAEELENVGIVSRNARGDGEILDVCMDATGDVMELRRKWLGERRIPHGDGEAMPILQTGI